MDTIVNDLHDGHAAAGVSVEFNMLREYSDVVTAARKQFEPVQVLPRYGCGIFDNYASRRPQMARCTERDRRRLSDGRG